MSKSYDHIINGGLNGPLSPLDRGLAYGDGVFRTLKVVNGVPEQWPMHYQKLVADCGAIGIVCPGADQLMSDFQQLFGVDEIAAAKIIITRGDGARGYTPPAITAPMRLMIKSPLPKYPQSHYVEGVSLHVCEVRLVSQPKLAGVKHLNRLENVLARMEWSDPTIAEGVMLDTADNVIECTSANIFARFGDTLLTPDLSQCGIAGITRQRILEFASTFSLKTKIEAFDLLKLYTADEVIICNSIYGAWHVRKINDRIWGGQNLAADIRKALSL